MKMNDLGQGGYYNKPPQQYIPTEEMMPHPLQEPKNIPESIFEIKANTAMALLFVCAAVYFLMMLLDSGVFMKQITFVSFICVFLLNAMIMQTEKSFRVMI